MGCWRPAVLRHWCAGSAAGSPAVSVVAVPPFSTPDDRQTSAGRTLEHRLGSVAADRRRTCAPRPRSCRCRPIEKDYYSYPEVTAPSFPKWRAATRRFLVTGFVQARSDGRVTFGCYVYDVEKGREVGAQGLRRRAGEWRRAAHKCSGLAYTAVDRRARHLRHAASPMSPRAAPATVAAGGSRSWTATAATTAI